MPNKTHLSSYVSEQKFHKNSKKSSKKNTPSDTPKAKPMPGLP